MSSSELPRWDLNIRFGFESPFDEKIDKLLETVEADSKTFRETYENHLEENLLQAIQEFEAISVQRASIGSYMSLSYDTQLNDDNLKKRKGALSQTQSSIEGDYLEWFTLDLAGIPTETIEKLKIDKPGLTKYNAFLEEVQRSKPHDLNKDVERALTVRSPYTGTRPLVSFLDKELSLMKFDLHDGKGPVNMEVLLSKLSSSKDASVRGQCMKALNDGLSSSTSRVAALSLSAVAGSWLIENKERSYQGLRSRRNLENNCPDAVVESLLTAVRSVGVTYCKRYYAMKKSILQQTQDLNTFRWSDRNAPIDISGGVEGEEEKKEDADKISWDEAVAMVERGYRKFSPHMADLFMGMINEKRIDVPAVDHKKGGAYCAGVVPGIGPFQLLNFDGTKNDVSTLAHESGHGCHDILAYKQGYLQYHPPLTLAETASIFGEMIVFRDLLNLAKNPQERLTLLMSKIDDVINSVVRQCSFDRFEELAHSARDKGELSAEELNGFWSQAMVEYYGKAGEDGGDSPFDDYEDSSYLWSYVPHFHHVPFYVYSYAFADLVVGSLYNSFQMNPDGFEDRLLDLLSAGGTLDFATALAPFGLDPKSPSFWEEALEAHLGALIQEAETIATELGYSSK
jgi:oligoendopeptidase F